MRYKDEKVPGLPLHVENVIVPMPDERSGMLSIGDSPGLQVGQTVVAIGNPLGITQTVTSGICQRTGLQRS